MKQKPKSTMRESQKAIFYREVRIVELRNKGKTIGWYGTRFPEPTAERIVREVYEEEK
jgi:hypothetical protein